MSEDLGGDTEREPYRCLVAGSGEYSRQREKQIQMSWGTESWENKAGSPVAGGQ